MLYSARPAVLPRFKHMCLAAPLAALLAGPAAAGCPVGDANTPFTLFDHRNAVQHTIYRPEDGTVEQITQIADGQSRLKLAHGLLVIEESNGLVDYRVELDGDLAALLRLEPGSTHKILGRQVTKTRTTEFEDTFVIADTVPLAIGTCTYDVVLIENTGTSGGRKLPGVKIFYAPELSMVLKREVYYDEPWTTPAFEFFFDEITDEAAALLPR